MVALPAVGSSAHPHGQHRPSIRNVILLIGDGMGDSEITIARNYAVGAAGHLVMDALPFTGQMTTFSLLEDDPSLPDYVPDSAATGTAWATGLKTSNGSSRRYRDVEGPVNISRTPTQTRCARSTLPM